MKLLLSYTLAFLFISIYDVQETEPPGRYEQRALKILDEAYAALNSLDAFYVEFDYLSDAGGYLPTMNDGGFLFTKGNMYHMKLDGNLFISDGITAWSFMEEINEVHISDVMDANGMITPTSLLDNYREDVHPLWIRKELYRGKEVHVIDLVPADPHTAFSKYRIGIDDATNLIAYVVAYDRHGGTYTYVITKTKTDPEIPDKIFTFNPEEFPGVEVIDLR